MKSNRMAKEMFLMYKLKVENEAEEYNRLSSAFPLGVFPIHAKRIACSAMLAEIWGTLATVLGGSKVDYMARWRQGL